jgi:hypothetical protein
MWSLFAGREATWYAAMRIIQYVFMILSKAGQVLLMVRMEIFRSISLWQISAPSLRQSFLIPPLLQPFWYEHLTTLEFLPHGSYLQLVGHSMGGSVIVRSCPKLLEKKYRIAGVAVLDVVEGVKVLDTRFSDHF